MQQHGTRSLLLLPGALLLLLVVAGLCPTVHARGAAAAAAAAGRANSFLPKARGAGRSSSQQGKPLPPLRASRAAARRDGVEEEEEGGSVLGRLLGARGGRSSGNYYGQQGGYGYDDGYDDGYSGGEGEAGGYDDGYGGAYGRPQQPPPRQRRPATSSRGSRGNNGRSGASGSSGFGGVGFSLNEPMPPSLRRAGFTLLGASLVLTMMGVSLFFERNLLRLGNLCLILGLPLYFGPGRVLRLLANREKLRASACFCLGVFLVLRGNSFLGTLLEIFGFFNLFANMFPLLLALLRNVPFVGELLKRPEPGSSRRGDSYYGGDYDRGYGGGGGRDRW